MTDFALGEDSSPRNIPRAALGRCHPVLLYTPTSLDPKNLTRGHRFGYDTAAYRLVKFEEAQARPVAPKSSLADRTPAHEVKQFAPLHQRDASKEGRGRLDGDGRGMYIYLERG